MDIKKIYLTLILSFCFFTTSLFGQTCFYPGNSNNWSNAFVGNGIPGRKTMAMATGSKGVYVLFQNQVIKKSGGLSNYNVVNLWDGKTWKPIGPSAFPFTGSTPALIGMELVGDTALYIAGNFTTTSTLNSNGIIRLNLKTNQYESVARGLGNGYAQRLKVFKDTLYVMGNFTRVRDANKTTVANYVARYFIGSNSWDSLGIGLGGFIPNIKDNIDFESLCQIDVAPSGEVFFAARFSSAGGTAANGIASWKSGRGWNNLYGGIKLYNGTTPSAGIGRSVVYSIKDTCLYIGGLLGYFNNPPTGKSGQFGWVRLRDTTWTKRVEGSSWNNDSIFNYNYPSFNSVTPYSSYYDFNDNKIYVAGDYQTFSTGDVKVFNINAQTFSKLNYGITSGSTITGLTKWNDTIFASGNNLVQVDSNIWVDNIAKFHSNKWHTVGKGLATLSTTKSINCIVNDNNGNCYFGGEFSNANGKILNSWGLIDSNKNLKPIVINLTGTNRKVYSILPKNDTVYLGGFFSGTSSIYSNGIIGYSKSNNSYMYIGSSGTQPFNSSWVNKIEKLGNLIIAAGSFTSMGGNNMTNLATWNGSTWSSFGNPNGEVKFMQTVGDSLLYIAGYFNNVNGSTRNYIAKYHINNGWQNVGVGLPNGDISALSVNPINGEVWIGYYNSISQSSGPSLSAQGYAVFDGSRWKDYGQLMGLNFSVLNAPIYIQHTADGTAYLSGTFSGINSQSSSNVLRYNSAYGWAGFGLSIITQEPFKNPLIKAISQFNNQLFLGGYFEGLSNGQASYCLASYELDNPLDNVITVDLGKDTTAFYGYSLKATIGGKYDSLVWSNGNKNLEIINVYQTNQYNITAYNNGCEDKDTAFITINGKNIYSGGIGDGFSSEIFAQYGKMSGGNGEGSSSYFFTQNGKMAGGIGDGFSSNQFTQNGRMAGGIGDGFSSKRFAQNGRMAGGIGDGFGNSLVKNNKTIYKGGKGDGYAMASYLALPDGTIRKIISPTTYIEKDSVEFSTWVHNIGNFPIYGFKVNWFVGGSLYTSEIFATDSILPNDSLAVKAKKHLQWQKEKLPLDICVLVSNINKEQDTSNNQMCYIIDKKTTIASINKNQFDIKLYPNPSLGISVLEIISKEQTVSHFKLIDLKGQKVYEKHIASENTKTELNLEDLTAGIYYFVFTQGKNTITGKIVLMR